MSSWMVWFFLFFWGGGWVVVVAVFFLFFGVFWGFFHNISYHIIPSAIHLITVLLLMFQTNGPRVYNKTFDEYPAYLHL